MKTKTLIFITLIVLPFLYVFTKPVSGKSASLAAYINLFKTPLSDTATPQLTKKNKEKNALNATATSIKTLKCAPWRSVVGYTALINELNGFYTCRQSECAGLSSYQTKTKMILDNGSGGAFVYSSNQSIPVTDQSSIITAADNWAVANTPGGFFVSVIKFVPDILVPTGGGGVTAAGLDITVTYKKCNGPKVPNN